MNLMKDELILENFSYQSRNYIDWSISITTHRIQVKKDFMGDKIIESVMLENIISMKFVKPSFVFEGIVLVLLFSAIFNLWQDQMLPFITSTKQLLYFLIIFIIAAFSYGYKKMMRGGLYILTSLRTIHLLNTDLLNEKELLSILDKIESVKNDRFLSSIK